MSSDLAPRLDSRYVEETVGRLEARIRARFPDRRLGDAAHALKTAVPQIHEGFEASKSRRRRIRWAARAASVVIVLAAVGALVLALRDPVLHGTESSVDWLPIIESTVNDLIFGSIAVFFLWALPERLERRTLLDLLHRLRSLAHVVDMHQLDKDPEQARADYHPTSVSPSGGSWTPRSCTTTSTTAASWSRSSPRPRRCVPSAPRTRSCSVPSARSRP